MRPVPPELLSIITGRGHRRTREAKEAMIRLGLREYDVLSVASSGRLLKKTRGPHLESRYIWSIEGHDTHGRQMYMAGKVTRRNGKTVWKIITIHEAAD